MKSKNDIFKNKKAYMKRKEKASIKENLFFKKEDEISLDRRLYLKNIKIKKFTILFFQIAILVSFIVIWEILGDLEIIDTFIMSQPSRILNTFMNLTSNDLIHHITVTTYETLVGFLIGTVLRNNNCNNFMVVRLFICNF